MASATLISLAASELPEDVFGKARSPCRLGYGVASLPLGTPVELELVFGVAGQELGEQIFGRFVSSVNSCSGTTVNS